MASSSVKYLESLEAPPTVLLNFRIYTCENKLVPYLNLHVLCSSNVCHKIIINTHFQARGVDINTFCRKTEILEFESGK